MIFYFSGTGNSQLAAKEIAKTIEDDIVSINQCLKGNTKQTFHSKRPLVIVAPVYAYRIPRVVEQWIRETDFQGNQNTYFVLTCGGSGGNAAVYAKKLCIEKGLLFQGLVSVPMPENYIALSSVPSETECTAIINRAKPVYSELAHRIQKESPFPGEPSSLKGWLLSAPIHLLYYRLAIHDKGFTVSDACVSCGKCAQRCPLNNVDLVKGKPLWKGNCTHCMACICGCPTNAIEYKSISKGKRRYYIMEE